ncbi:MAG: GntR family transcriptional regulator, partial [Nitrospiraceae bacterium]|nr:GntR family transcriptional regulator [Nitrospiraceae bacterium]
MSLTTPAQTGQALDPPVVVAATRLRPVQSQPGSPLYATVKDAMLEAIRNGIYKPGDRLPSTKHLSEQLEVSLVTTHRALQELESRGVLDRTASETTFRSITPRFTLAEEDARLRGLGEFFGRLRQKGIAFILATNNAGQTPTTLLGKMLRIDVDLPAPYIPRRQSVRHVDERVARDLALRRAQPPGASPSTARRATCTSATSARTRARRSTSSPRRARAARTTAGTTMEGSAVPRVPRSACDTA